MPVTNTAYINLIMEEIKSLPKTYATEVFDFVSYLKSKAAKQEDCTSDEGNTSNEECPICARLRDPVTGEEQFNAETIAGIKEVDDMIAGKKPNTMKAFNSLEEMLADLDSDD